jgi:DNA-binding beta-propeller fold protein YncE
MKHFITRASVVVIAIIITFSVSQSQHLTNLRLKAVIQLPRVEGRIDHMDIDLKTRRVFVAALGNNTVEVVSLDSSKRLRTLTGFKEPQGVLFIPHLNKLYISNGGDGTCTILDAISFKESKTLTLLDDADNIRYDKSAGMVYAGCGTGSLALFDPAKAEMSHLLPLPDHPESFQIDSLRNRIYVNVPNAKQIVVLDRSKQKTIETWPLKDAEKNYPMALDEKLGLIFVGCRAPARLLVLNALSGALVASILIDKDVDDIFFDAVRHHLYVSCGEGFIDIISQETPNEYKQIDRIPTRTGARTSLFVPSLDLYILAVPMIVKEEAQMQIYSVE